MLLLLPSKIISMIRLTLNGQRIKARQSRNRPQKLGAMISQSVAAMRHWVTESELDSIQQSGVPILVATSKLLDVYYM